MKVQGSMRGWIVGALVLATIGFLGYRVNEVIVRRREMSVPAVAGQYGGRGNGSRQPGAGQNGARPTGGGQAFGGQMGRGLEAPSIQVERVGRGSIQETVLLSGTLEPQYQVDVFTRRAGRLASVAVQMGQRVRRGDPIASVEHSDLLLQQRQSAASLAASKAGYRRAEVQRDKVATDYERVKLLYDQRATTQQELRNVTDQLKEAEIQLEVARAQVEQAEANSALVQLQLEQADTDAPVAGVVLKTLAVVGSQVTTSTPIATIAAVDPIEVVFPVAEKDIGRLAAGQEFAVRVDAFPQEVFQGRIATLGATVDTSTRTISVRGRVPNSKLRLRPGMFARVELAVGRKSNVIALPREALLTRGEGYQVFVVADGAANLRPVKIGIQGRDRVEILEGLREGEVVAVVGHQQLRDGQQVRSVSVSGASAPVSPQQQQPPRQGRSAGSPAGRGGNGR